jgi:hypothetical protein
VPARGVNPPFGVGERLHGRRPPSCVLVGGRVGIP